MPAHSAPSDEALPSSDEVPQTIHELRTKFRDFPINTKPDPTLKRDLQPGFLLPYLLDFDALTYGRWEYWCEACGKEALPERPIPQIDFLDSADQRTRKMLETALDCIPRYGSWQSMGGWEYFRYLLQWLLWGFGHPTYNEPEEPFGCEGASMRLYQTLNLCAWMLWPYDYLGDLLAENAYGRKQGFFPTPMPLCQLITQMVMGGSTEDTRIQTVCDPAVGTGRFLLAASNYSLRLYGQDIDPTMCMATLVNGYLFAPYLVKPLPFLDGVNLNPEHSQAISDSITAQAPPHVAAQIGDTEYDAAEGFRFEPIKKRSKTDHTEKQGILF